MKYSDLEDIIKCCNHENRYRYKEIWSEGSPEGRLRKFGYDKIIAEDKTNPDIFQLKDKSLTDMDNFPDPEIPANEVIENMGAPRQVLKKLRLQSMENEEN